MLNNMTTSPVLPPLPLTIAASLEGMATTVLAIEEWLVKQQLIPILFNHARSCIAASISNESQHAMLDVQLQAATFYQAIQSLPNIGIP